VGRPLDLERARRPQEGAPKPLKSLALAPSVQDCEDVRRRREGAPRPICKGVIDEGELRAQCVHAEYVGNGTPRIE
jgi:hypothetical protein